METLSIEWRRGWDTEYGPFPAATFRIQVKSEKEAKRLFEAMRGVLRALAPHAKLAEPLSDPDKGRAFRP